MRRSRAVARVGVPLIVLLIGVTAVVNLVYLNPTTDPVQAWDPADAVVALAGEPRSVGTALALVEQGAAPELVVSNGYGPRDAQMRQLCGSPPPRVRVTCFEPDPDTTRGEARAVGRLARDRGWNDLVVVTSTFHVSRARLILRRCYPGRLRMAESPEARGVTRRAYELGYQSAAFVKAAVLRGC